MKTQVLEPDTIRASVRDHYARVATTETGCGCAPSCCSTAQPPAAENRSADGVSHAVGYSIDQTGAVPDGANLGLGCGNPLAFAEIKPGQTVLDLGSGAGFDAFLAAKAVGPKGRVIGVDMTPEMIRKARRNQTKGDYSNVQFRLGEIERLPVADASVDVIISNCVVNLSPDKDQVFREAHRVLKPGGRIALADILSTKPLPEGVRKDLELYAACVAGASSVADVASGLREAGFSDVRIEAKPGSREVIRDWFPGRGIEECIVSATIEAVKS